MKKFMLAVIALFLTCIVIGAIAEDWDKPPVITKAYEQSQNNIFVEWEGNAPLYQVYLDGKKVADTMINHQVINVEKGAHVIVVYPFNKSDKEANTTFSLEAIGAGVSFDLAALGLDPKELTPGNPSEKLTIDYKPSQVINGKPEKISAYTDAQNRVVLSFEDPYVADEYLLTIKRRSNINYVSFYRNKDTDVELFSEEGSMVTLTLDQAYLKEQECLIPELNEEYRFTVQFRKYATDYVTGGKEKSVVNDSKISSEYVYRLVPIWKIAPVITFASQTADGQITLMWDHEDYGIGCEYHVMKINKVMGIMTGEDDLGKTSDHEYVINDMNNGGYCINIVPVLNGEKGSYSADANIDIKNEWVIAPSLNCEQIADNQVRLTWKAPENIERYHITVLRGDNNSLLRFIDLDYSKYTEFDVSAVQGDMEYIYIYDDSIDSVNGTKLKFEIYGIRRTTTGGEQRSATSSKTIILK